MAIRVNGTLIQVPQGDTGVVQFAAEKDGITAENRGVFTLAQRNGTAILRKVIEPDMSENAFRMMLNHDDTAALRPGYYDWSFRVVREGTFDAGGRLIDAQQQHTAVLKGRLCVMEIAGGVR